MRSGADVRHAAAMKGHHALYLFLALGCGSTPPIAEIPPLDQEEVIADLDAQVEESPSDWRPETVGGGIALGAKDLATGETLSLEGSPCEEVVVYVAEGRLQDGGAERSAGTLLRTQDMISLRALAASRVVVSINTLTRADCVPTDDATITGVQPIVNAGGKLRVTILLDAQSGGTIGSFSILDADADLGVPAHVHETSTEVLLIVSGDGTMRRGDESFPIEPGMTIAVPAGIEHSYEPGTHPLRAYQVYTPPGPEQRFRTP